MSDNKEIEFVVSDEKTVEPAVAAETTVSAQPTIDAQPVINAQPTINAQPAVNAQPGANAGQAKAVPEGMPNKGAYTALLIIGFICGIIWGLLSISPYSKMSKAIEAGNAAEAWDNAKKVKIFCLIGIAVNVLMVMFSCGAN